MIIKSTSPMLPTSWSGYSVMDRHPRSWRWLMSTVSMASTWETSLTWSNTCSNPVHRRIVVSDRDTTSSSRGAKRRGLLFYFYIVGTTGIPTCLAVAGSQTDPPYLSFLRRQESGEKHRQAWFPASARMTSQRSGQKHGEPTATPAKKRTSRFGSSPVNKLQAEATSAATSF